MTVLAPVLGPGVLQPGERGVVAQLTDAEQVRVRSVVVGSLSGATRAAYWSDWARWERWCTGRGAPAWPADPGLVGVYVAEHAVLLEPGGAHVYSAGTLARWVSALNRANRELDASPPGEDPRVQAVLAGAREHSHQKNRPRRREPLLLEDLTRVVTTITDAASSWAQRMAARRDVAVLAVGWAGGFRPSELAGLCCGDVAFHPGDGLHVRVVRSETDQARGEVKVLPFGTRRETCPVCAVLAWVQVLAAWDEAGRAGVLRLLRQPEPTGHVCRPGWLIPSWQTPLFRSVHPTGVLGGPLSGPAISDMMRRRARQAGLDPGKVDGFGGPMPRAGSSRGPTGRGPGARHRPRARSQVPGGAGLLPAGKRFVSGARGEPGRPSSAPGYAREWARFADWCTATGRTALPATPADVLAYLVEEQPTGGTAARWVAGIRAAHHGHGTDPTAGPPAVWVRRARGGSPAPDPGAVAGVLAGVPTTGWPVGVFGRRDRLAFLLHRLGGLPVRTLVRLRVQDLSVPEPGCLRVDGGGAGILVQGPGRDAVVCPACAAVSWLKVLHHEVTDGWRALAARLARAETHAGHLCGQRPCDPAPTVLGWPMFPAVNRWGHLPVPPAPAMSQRALAEVLRRVQAGVNTHATIPLPQPAAGQEPELAVELPAPASPALSTTWHRDGVLARRRARASLAEVTDQFDELLAGIEQVEARVAQVIHTAVGGPSTDGA